MRAKDVEKLLEQLAARTPPARFFSDAQRAALQKRIASADPELRGSPDSPNCNPPANPASDPDRRP